MSTADLHFERRPAIQGWRWLQRAFAMFRRYWVIWSLLVVAYLVLISLIAPIPYLGRSAAFILKPIFTVGFLAAAWSQERGEDPKLSQLFAGFRSNLYALVPIGFVYWIGIMLALLATAWGDQGTMARFIFYGEIPRDDYLSSPELERAMLIALACAVPVVLANWFAPALVVFGDAGPIAALTTSLRAALVNWRAALVFGLGFLLASGLIPGILLALFVALLGETGGALWMFSFMPIWLSLLATLYISDYVSYRDVFHNGEAITATPPPSGV